MGSPRPATTVPRAAWPTTKAFRQVDSRRHLLRRQRWLRLAALAPRLSAVGYHVLLVSAMATGRPLAAHPRSFAHGHQAEEGPGSGGFGGDSGQSVRIAEKSGSNQGYDAAERVSGRKRNLLADTSGLLLAQRVPTVNICGNRIARELLAAHLSSCPRGGLWTPSFTFSGAAAYGGCCCKNTHLAKSEKTMR